MQYFPAALQELADQFARLPGVGGKTAQRLAFYVLGMPLNDAQAFADAIMEAKTTAEQIAEIIEVLTEKQDRISEEKTTAISLKGGITKYVQHND